MHGISRDDGFTLTELLVSTTITLLVLGGAMTTVRNALSINDTGTQLADANQNLRAGTNLLIRDLMQVGRMIPTGVPIPSGAGATVLSRPSPPGQAYAFDNTNATMLPAIVTGFNLGPTVDNSPTDIVTMLTVDPFDCASILGSDIAAGGTSVTLGAASPWMTGSGPTAPCDNATATKVGDLVWFNYGNGAIGTVTSTDSTAIYFAPNDWFGFNQAGAAQGTLTLFKASTPSSASMKIYRLYMLTYYVDATTTPGTPRLTRMQNHFGAQALAGVVEDLDITYDLVDGSVNPVNIGSLPYTLNNLTYTSNQIRKVNLHIGVRSDLLSRLRNDYIRNHLWTSVSVRDLASVSRYF